MSLHEMVKRVAVDAYETTNPVNVVFGEVKKSKPLEIEVESKYILTDEFLVVAERLTRHERIVTIEHVEMTERKLGDKTEIDYLDTDDKAYPATSYKHSFVKMIFEDGLKVGDKVVLFRMQGGHQFYVSDRYKEGDKAWSYPSVN